MTVRKYIPLEANSHRSVSKILHAVKKVLSVFIDDQKKVGVFFKALA
jgi:hypothetical protein